MKQMHSQAPTTVAINCKENCFGLELYLNADESFKWNLIAFFFFFFLQDPPVAVFPPFFPGCFVQGVGKTATAGLEVEVWGVWVWGPGGEEQRWSQHRSNSLEKGFGFSGWSTSGVSPFLQREGPWRERSREGRRQDHGGRGEKDPGRWGSLHPASSHQLPGFVLSFQSRLVTSSALLPPPRCLSPLPHSTSRPCGLEGPRRPSRQPSRPLWKPPFIGTVRKPTCIFFKYSQSYIDNLTLCLSTAIAQRRKAGTWGAWRQLPSTLWSLVSKLFM